MGAICSQSLFCKKLLSIEQQEQFALAALYKRVIKIEIDFLTVVARANRFQLLFNLLILSKQAKSDCAKERIPNHDIFGEEKKY